MQKSGAHVQSGPRAVVDRALRETGAWGLRHMKLGGIVIALGGLGGLIASGSAESVHDTLAAWSGVIVAGAAMTVSVFAYYMIQAPVLIAKHQQETDLQAKIERLKAERVSRQPNAVVQFVRRQTEGATWTSPGVQVFQAMRLTKKKPGTLLIMEASVNIESGFDLKIQVLREKKTLVYERNIRAAVGNEPTIIKFTDHPGVGPVEYLLRLASHGAIRTKEEDNWWSVMEIEET